MLIKYIGHACFKIETKSRYQNNNNKLTIFTDPFGEDIGLIPPKGQADIVTISHSHFDHNNPRMLSGDYFLATNPGEYTYKGVSIRGILSYHDEEKGALRGINTIFVIEAEDLRICHLGDLGHVPGKNLLEKIGSVDILMIPVGNKFTLDAVKAKETISLLEPKMVIPMHFLRDKLLIEGLAPVSDFYKTMGQETVEQTDKLKIQLNTLPLETKIIELTISQ